MKAFINGKVLIGDVIRDDVVVLFDERIRSIDSTPGAAVQLIDLAGHYLFPGLIDIHIHGAGGGDVMQATAAAYQKISRTLAKFGVTRFLATTMTMPMTTIKRALTVARQVMTDDNLSGAKPLGVHLEGPFISEKYCGAQDVRYIKRPTWDDIADYRDIIKIITLAVEKDDDYKFIADDHGITLSIGHSAATFEQALASYQKGVRHCTHCFNAMSGLHHRAPGVVGAVFSRPYMTELIADGVHIHAQLLNAIVRIVGRDNLILISDGMSALGMPPGQYQLGGQRAIVDGTSARLADGQLAGSILSLDQAIRNMVEYTNCDLADIVNMATRNAANSIACAADYGAIKLNASADFVVMDESLSVVSTWLAGNCIYQK